MTWTRLTSAQHRARAKLLLKKAQSASQPPSSRCLHDKEEAASAPRPMLQRDQGVVLRRGA
jgi:hypothetical protein